jgi:hypothetical protein
MIHDDTTQPCGLARDARVTEHALFVDRTETKYLVAPQLALALARALALELAPHLPPADGSHVAVNQGWVRTVYFDTTQRDLYREAVASPAHVKVRVREYHAPSTTNETTVWLEIKERNGVRSRKRRAAIDKRELARRLEAGLGGVVTATHGVAPHDAVVAEVARIAGRHPTPLRPDCVVSYRRTAWQDNAGSLRVTVDRDVGFFAPPAQPFAPGVRLGAARASLTSAVVEIKLRGAMPPWLERWLREHDLTAQSFSKFASASRAVHG